MEDEWKQLLDDSTADPLFMSWVWIKNWWHVFGNKGEDKLKILGVYSNNQLMALAPLYFSKQKARFITIRRLQFLGNRWRDRKNIRSEYIDFICRSGSEEPTMEAIVDHIYEKLMWDEFVICNHCEKSVISRVLASKARVNRSMVRKQERGTTFSIEMSESDFPEYLKSLSSKTRLSLYNHRKKLKKKGDIEVQSVGVNHAASLLEKLNEFHQKRWKKNLFEGKRYEFHKHIIPDAAMRNILDATALKVNGEVVSMLYDFKVKGVKYGFQLGFDQTFDKKISISQLHIGYAIERAFDEGLIRYDFLRGMGKSTKSYKGSMAQPYRETLTTQIIRNPVMKCLYWMYDKCTASKTR